MAQVGLNRTAGQDNDTMQGEYLTFSLGEKDLYGMEIRYITEIVGIQEITRMPEMPLYMKGITNLRGKVIPIMDARLRFGKEERAYDARTCIIVMDTGTLSVGLIVDSVVEVLTIPDEDIAPPPDMGGSGHGYIQGIAKTQGRIALLMDCKRLLNDDDLREMNAAL